MTFYLEQETSFESVLKSFLTIGDEKSTTTASVSNKTYWIKTITKYKKVKVLEKKRKLGRYRYIDVYLDEMNSRIQNWDIDYFPIMYHPQDHQCSSHSSVYLSWTTSQVQRRLAPNSSFNNRNCRMRTICSYYHLILQSGTAP